MKYLIVFFFTASMGFAQEFINGDFSRDIDLENKNPLAGWIQDLDKLKWEMKGAKSGAVQNIKKSINGYLAQTITLSPLKHYVLTLEVASSSKDVIPLSIELSKGAKFLTKEGELSKIRIKTGEDIEIVQLANNIKRVKVYLKTTIGGRVMFTIVKNSKKMFITHLDNIKIGEGKPTFKIQEKTVNTDNFPVWSE